MQRSITPKKLSLPFHRFGYVGYGGKENFQPNKLDVLRGQLLGSQNDFENFQHDFVINIDYCITKTCITNIISL